VCVQCTPTLWTFGLWNFTLTEIIKPDHKLSIMELWDTHFFQTTNAAEIYFCFKKQLFIQKLWLHCISHTGHWPLASYGTCISDVWEWLIVWLLSRFHDFKLCNIIKMSGHQPQAFLVNFCVPTLFLMGKNGCFCYNYRPKNFCSNRSTHNMGVNRKVEFTLWNFTMWIHFQENISSIKNGCVVLNCVVPICLFLTY
jgi:hypothetical protein